MRTIGVVTVARSDYGIYLPILRQIQDAPDLKLHLIVSGMHLSPEFGLTIRNIEADGFEINDRVEMLLSSDTPEGITKSTGLGIIGFSQVYARFQPDILLVLGDRFEMMAATIAAMPYNIPIAHIHGGETSEGAIDEAIRHAITKISHLHFVSTLPYRNRVIQMGEASWRVIVSGAPSLDNLHTIEPLEKNELEQQFGLSLAEPPVLVTYHPVTLEYQNTASQIHALLQALDALHLPVVFTYPNADTNGRVIIEAINDFVSSHSMARAVTNFGTRGYFAMLRNARVMVGNSSSGIIEAASFELPVVNIGNRQRGRIHSHNVINCSNEAQAIEQAIQQAISLEFRDSLVGMENPYGDGQATVKIVDTLRSVTFDRNLLKKQFADFADFSP